MLQLVTDLEIFTVYALRTDVNKMPIIEAIQLYKSEDSWGKEIFRALHKVESKNELYPYDALNYRQYVKSNSISDCYSKGYIFHNRFDAVKRLELLVDKKENKVEKELNILADWKNRLALIKGKNEKTH